MIQKNSRLKRLAVIGAYVLGIYLLLMALAVLAFPSFISSEMGTKLLLEKIVNKKIPGELKIKKISVGWFSNQSYEDIDLFSSQGDLLAHIDTLETSTPIWKLLLSGGELRQFKVKNLNAFLDENLIELIHKLKKLHTADSFLTENLDPLALSSVDLDFDFNPTRNFYHFNADGFVNYKTKEGSFSLQGKILAPKDLECSYICEKSILSLQGEMVDIPEVFFRRLLMMKNPDMIPSSPLPFIGDNINAKIAYENVEGKDTLHLTVQTSTAKGNLELFLNENIFKLVKPAEVTLEAVEAKNLKINLNQLAFSLSEDRPLIIDLNLKSDYFQAGDWAIRNLAATLSSDEKGVFFLKTEGLVEDLDKNSKFRRYWGNQPKVELSTSLVSEEEKKIQMPDFKLKITNPKDQIELSGHIHTYFNEVFHYGAVFNTMLKPETLERWGIDFNAHHLIREPLDVRISLTPSIIPFSGPFLNQILNGGEIKIKKIAFAKGKSHHVKQLENVSFPWVIDGQNNKIKLRYKSYIVYDNDTPTHKLRFHANFFRWLKEGKINFDQLSIDIGASLPNVPIDLFVMLTGVKHLDKLVGDTLNINMKGNIDPEKTDQGLIDLNFSGKLFKARAKLLVGDTITLTDENDKAFVEWVINQSRFDSLMSMIDPEKKLDTALTIQESAKINLTLANLSVPWKGFSTESFRTSLSKLAGNVEVSLQNLQLVDKKSGNSANYNSIKGKLQTKALSEEVSFSLKGEGVDLPGNKPFSLLFTGHFDNLFNDQNLFNIPALSVTFEALLQKAPLALLTQFFYPYHELHHQIDALLGSRIDGFFHAHLNRLQGSIDSNLSGEQGRLSFAGTVVNGVLSLYKPLKAEVNVTPKLGSSVLRYFNPLLSTAQSSDQPIKVIVDNGGFSLPLHPWQLNEINMPGILIEAGKLKFKNNGELGQVLSLLNYKPKINEDINVWILPIQAAIKDGKINIERIDMLLADTFPIAIWGSADLPDNKLKMTIGLTPVALNNAFKIRGLPQGSMLQLPLRGTLEKATLDTKSASAQIASLIAHAQGPQGAIIGSVIDILSRQGDKRVPAAKTEVPWKTDLPEDKSSGTIEKGAKFIEKHAENVIKKLFK